MPDFATTETKAPAEIARLESETRHRDQRIVFSISAVLAVVTFTLFSRALGGEILIWDDEINLWFTPQILKVDLTSLAWMFTDTEQVLRYKPLCWLIWAGMIQIFGDSSPFRLPNLLLHTINSILLFLLLLGFIKRSANRTDLRSYVVAAGMAAFWAWSPSRIEPVTWISGLGYPLALSFSLLSALLFRNALSLTTPGHRRWILALSIFTWILGLISYPSALCALPLFPILAMKGSNPPHSRTILKRASGHILLGGFLVAGTLATRIWSNGVWTENALISVSPFEQIARLAYFPLWVLSQTNPFTTIGPIHDGLTSPILQNPLVLGGALMLISVTFLVLRARTRIPLVVWVSFLVALIPHVGLTEGRFLPADRYTYTASIFLLMLLGSMASDYSTRVHAAASTAVALAVFVSLPLCWNQALIWRTNEALFHHTYQHLKTDLYRADILLRLGRLEHANGNLERAKELFTQSAKYSTRDPLIDTFLVKICKEQAQVIEATEQHRLVQDPDPDNSESAAGINR
jgi:hypothetical protein